MIELNSRRTLAEITERVEAALLTYEQMEENSPERFDGIRRKEEVDSSLSELAEGGRARVEVYVFALKEISSERQALLEKLKEKLEADKASADKAEKEERRGGAHLDAMDEEVVDETRLLEQLDNLEALQQKIGAAWPATLLVAANRCAVRAATPGALC